MIQRNGRTRPSRILGRVLPTVPFRLALRTGAPEEATASSLHYMRRRYLSGTGTWRIAFDLAARGHAGQWIVVQLTREARSYSVKMVLPTRGDKNPNEGCTTEEARGLERPLEPSVITIWGCFTPQDGRSSRAGQGPQEIHVIEVRTFTSSLCFLEGV